LQPMGDPGDSVRLLLTVLSTVCGLGILTLRLSAESGELERADARIRMMAAATEQTADLILITRANGTFDHANDACVQALGYTRAELAGMTLPELLQRGLESIVKHIGQEVRQKGIWRGTLVHRRKDGSTFPASATVVALRNGQGKVTHFVGVERDVTEDLRLRDQLVHSERLSAVGELVAGVAHEINNPVGFISANLNTLKTWVRSLLDVIAAHEAALPQLEPAQRDALAAMGRAADLDYVRDEIATLIDESIDGALRVRRIVQDLRDFSRPGSGEWCVADIHAGLESTLNVVHNELKYKADIVREYGDLPPVECLPSQLNQVFMNLLVNAAHAIPERGVITIRTSSDDEHVSIAISDTGTGMTPDIVRRIFDPFFTTKPVGQGTGLGLSVSHGIVERHRGTIDVTSEPGRGTTFRIRLPIRRAETSASASESESMSETAAVGQRA